MDNQKVSIVVSIYNGKDYIDECIGGILAQTYKNIECILVDDGSTDGSDKICDDYSKKYPEIRVIHKKNAGPSSARNTGLDAADGDYVVFFDVDDRIKETTISDNLKLAIQNDADVVFFCFWYYMVDKDQLIENGMERNFIGNAKSFFEEALIPILDNEVYNAPWNKLFKRQFLLDNNLRFMPEYSIYEDMIFITRMLQKAKNIAVNKDMYYTYCLKSSGSLITKFVDHYFDAVTELYNSATKYCGMYENNEMQLKKYSAIYLKQVFTNLKQISCRKSVGVERKYELIKNICDSEEVNTAISLAEMKGRKNLICSFLRRKDYKNIYRIYNIINTLQGKKMQ